MTDIITAIFLFAGKNSLRKISVYFFAFVALKIFYFAMRLG